MGNTKVTSIRLNTELLESASAFGLNISKICEAAIKAELNERLLDHNVIPPEITGVSKNAHILMADEKFKEISKLQVGDSIISFNPFNDCFEKSNVISVGPLNSEEAFKMYLRIQDAGGSYIDLLPATKIWAFQSDASTHELIPAQEITQQDLIKTISIKKCSSARTITNIEKMPKQEIFYRLEVYPNNTFIANSNQVRLLHLNDTLPAVWGFGIQGYAGQVGRILERQYKTPPLKLKIK